MSVEDVLQSDAPKRKKDGKRKDRVRAKALTQNVPAVVNAVDSEKDERKEKSEKKRDKKDKKRKREADENANANGARDAREEGNVQPEQVNDTNGHMEAGVRKEKKKKRKHDAEEAAAAGLGTPDTPTESVENNGQEKKRKKKRRDGGEDDIGANGTAVADDAPKKRKRKHKESTDDAEPEASVPHPTEKRTDAAPDSDPAAPSAATVAAYLAQHSITLSAPAHAPAPEPAALPTFAALAALLPPAARGLRTHLAAFAAPTPVQACSWPAALAGRDVVGVAETGSGKTLAFGIPAVARLAAAPRPKQPAKRAQAQIAVLVVAPTRELALQTHAALSALGAPLGLGCVAVYGGVDKAPQKRALASADATMVAGTPGRILDLVNEGACDLSGVTYLVLDEADRMLDSGFENDIRAIIGHTAQPEHRQTLMFSATWPEAVRRLAASFQRDPVRITVGSDDLTANSRVEQVVEVFDDSREKDARLNARLRELHHNPRAQAASRILIFVLYKKEAARVEGMLRRAGHAVAAIHGDMSQPARVAALDGFKTGHTRLLVATDVAARGLDIPDVAAVVNYSFPLTIEDYIHRIGRTGRGGRSGRSITFFTGDGHERALAGELARVLREGGFDVEGLKKFPMTIKKKTHSAYGAFFRDDAVPAAAPTHLTFT